MSYLNSKIKDKADKEALYVVERQHCRGHVVSFTMFYFLKNAIEYVRFLRKDCGLTYFYECVSYRELRRRFHKESINKNAINFYL